MMGMHVIATEAQPQSSCHCHTEPEKNRDKQRGWVILQQPGVECPSYRIDLLIMSELEGNLKLAALPTLAVLAGRLGANLDGQLDVLGCLTSPDQEGSSATCRGQLRSTRAD